MSLKRRVWVEIDFNKLRRNYFKIASSVTPSRVLCVMKANAYGLGVLAYADALAQTDALGFGVAEPFEALQLKEANLDKPIHILSSVLPDEIEDMVKAGIVLPVTDYEQAKSISLISERLGKKTTVHFKIDTGMGRLGILARDAVETITKIKALPALECDGIFSHCAMAYEPINPFTQDQINTFKNILAELRTRSIFFKQVHIAASDAINNFPEAVKPPFNVVRTGINLHGSFDPNGRRALSLESVLTLKTRVAQVRMLPAGTTLGYGRTWCLGKETPVATISAGYADGLPLALSNRGYVLIRGVVCPVIGRVSMDYTTVDVSRVPDVTAGDEVICLGGDGASAITPDYWASLKGTHAYDIICSLGSRVQRIVV